MENHWIENMLLKLHMSSQQHFVHDPFCGSLTTGGSINIVVFGFAYKIDVYSFAGCD